MSMLWLVLAALAQEAPKVDEKAKTVSFPAKSVQLETQPQLKGFIEYVLVNKGGKEYESLFSTEVDPLAVHEGLKKIGVQPGRPGGEDDNGKTLLPTGGKVRIHVELKDGETTRKEPIEKFILDVQTGKTMESVDWIFTGSKEGFVPELEKNSLLVLSTKNLIGLLHRDGSTLLTNPVVNKDEHRYKGNPALLPKAGTAVTIVFEAVP